MRRTIEETPPGATHWSTRLMAGKVGVSAATVGRIWQAFGLKPHRLAPPHASPRRWHKR